VILELLVVILIIGILASIAIPTFLGTKSTAYDVGAESLAQAAQTSAEIYATDHERSAKEEEEGKGRWSNMTAEALREFGPSLRSCPNLHQPCLKSVTLITAGTEGYEITTESPQTKDEFTVKDKLGTITRTCKHEGKEVKAGETKGSCTSGTWTGQAG
jgi:type II secretory pathway pseudopilin PulG